MKKYFSIDKRVEGYSFLAPEAQGLVDAGFEIVKSHFAQKAKSDGKKNFVDMLSGETIDVSMQRNNDFMAALVKYCLRGTEFNTENFDISIVRNPSVHKNETFRSKFNSILAQIIRPVPPAYISAEYMSFADVSNIGWGDSAKFLVGSNDSFFVTKHAEGILTGAIQRIYNDEINVMPEVYNIKTTVDWYQVAAGMFSLGDFVWRVGASFANYITLMVVEAIEGYVTAGMAGAYKTSGFTPAKFANLLDIVQAANGGVGCRAYGTLSALMAVIPGVDTNTTIANLQMGLGQEWSRVGYLGTWFGTDMIRVPQILLPNTVNTNPLLGIPNDLILIMPDGGYKPVKIVFEGSTITLDVIPTEAPDKEMGVDVSMRMGMAFINASKFGAITDVVAPV